MSDTLRKELIKKFAESLESAMQVLIPDSTDLDTPSNQNKKIWFESLTLEQVREIYLALQNRDAFIDPETNTFSKKKIYSKNGIKHNVSFNRGIASPSQVGKRGRKPNA